jgi:co-chaperonin GroES (HSP10)
MLKSPCDYLFIRMEKAFEDEIATSNGVKLYRNTDLQPEWTATVVGEVVSVPNRITTDEGHLQFKPNLKGFIPEAEAGDQVIFSYQVVHDGTPRDRDSYDHKNLFLYNGDFLWKVDYQFVLGYIKNGEIIAASGYTFLEEMEEEITGVDLRDLLGGSDVNIHKYVEKLGNKGGIVTATVGETIKVKNKARVAYVGKTRAHEPNLNLKKGDVIRYDQRFGMKYEIKGNNYIILMNQYIVAKEIKP